MKSSCNGETTKMKINYNSAQTTNLMWARQSRHRIMLTVEYLFKVLEASKIKLQCVRTDTRVMVLLS